MKPIAIFILLVCIAGCSNQEIDQSKKIDSLEKIISSKINNTTSAPKEVQPSAHAESTEDINWQSMSKPELKQKINEIIAINNNGTNVGHVPNSIEQWGKFKDIMNNEEENMHRTFTFKAQVEAKENGEPYVVNDKEGGISVIASINGVKGDGAIWMVFPESRAFSDLRNNIRGNETYAFKGIFVGVQQGSEFPYGLFLIVAIRRIS